MKTGMLRTLLAVMFLIFFQTESFACGCVSMGLPFEQEISGRLKNGDAVFSGKVIGLVDKAKYRNVTLKVGEFWKGDVTAQFTVASDKTTSSCAFNFEVGKSYLIFASVWEGNLYTGACSYDRELEKAGDYLKILGKGKMPKRAKTSQ